MNTRSITTTALLALMLVTPVGVQAGNHEGQNSPAPSRAQEVQQQMQDRVRQQQQRIREEARQQREQVQDGQQNLRERIDRKQQQAKEEFRQRRKEFQERRQQIQEQRQQEIRERIQSRREEAFQRVQERLKSTFSSVLTRFEAALDRLDIIADRIDQHISEAAASDTSTSTLAARQQLQLARDRIDQARTQFDTFADQLTNATQNAERPGQIVQQIQPILREARSETMSARDALMETVRIVKRGKSSEAADDDDQSMTRECREQFRAAREAAAGKVCTQQVQRMQCPADNSVRVTAPNGCVISALEANGWTPVAATDNGDLSDRQRCQRDLEAAREAAEGRACTELAQRMTCPYDTSVTPFAENGCVSSELQSRGWSAGANPQPRQNQDTSTSTDSPSIQ